MYPNHFGGELVENCEQTICFGFSILFLYATSHKVWLFEKIIFQLEHFLDNSIMLRQLKSRKKMVDS